MAAPAMDTCRYAAFEGNGQAFNTPKMVQPDADPKAAYPSDTGFQVLELPYLGKRLSMLFILPRTADGLNKLLEGWNETQWSTIRNALAERKVNVKIPKFKMEASYQLIPHLRGLGMEDAFSEANADFSGLAEPGTAAERLYISLVIHKAFVEVNEQGTEAAAATIVGMARAAAPAARPFTPDFTADRPFLAAIVDNSHDAILFLGKIESPTA